MIQCVWTYLLSLLFFKERWENCAWEWAGRDRYVSLDSCTRKKEGLSGRTVGFKPTAFWLQNCERPMEVGKGLHRTADFTVGLGDGWTWVWILTPHLFGDLGQIKRWVYFPVYTDHAKNLLGKLWVDDVVQITYSMKNRVNCSYGLESWKCKLSRFALNLSSVGSYLRWGHQIRWLKFFDTIFC